MRKLIALSSLLGLTFAFSAVAAKPANDFVLPDNAKEVAPNVFSLGKAYDSQTHETVEGYAIVHKKGSAKSSAVKTAPKSPTCYGYLAAGAKWKGTAEPWRINATNSGLDGSFLLSNTTANISKWESAGGANILGNGSSVDGPATNKNVVDGINEVSFGHIADSNTIAVTTVWGYFSGPTSTRQLVEWDQIFNTDYVWSSSGAADKMDYENISTHELGHAVGMGDIYTAGCSQVTMYGYATEGEIIKRDLAPADITGISNLY